MTTTIDQTQDSYSPELLDKWQIPGGSFYGSSWRSANLSLPVHNPEDGSLLGCVSQATLQDVELAVSGITTALKSTTWPVWARRESLLKASEILLAESDRFARIISAESSKTITEAEKEVLRGAETLRLSANATAFLTGETLPFEDSRRGAGRTGWFSLSPVGIVAAITPFNDPLNLVAHKIGPALAAGNGVVLKPASSTPLTALALVALLLEAGVPNDRLAVLCGGAAVGEALVSHAHVDMVSFTGGPETANRITAVAGPKKMLMELGGNNAVLVGEDADPSSTAQAIVDGAFGVAGQNCLSVQRVYVATSIFDQVLANIVERTKRLSVGSKADRNTDVGPMISEREAQRVEERVHGAVAAGATVLVGGHREGAFYSPTVLTEVPTDHDLIKEEIFGPVVCVQPFEDWDQVIETVNADACSLQIGVFTNAMDAAFAAAEKLQAGSVIINGTSDFRVDSMPFGGFGRSGIGREGVRYALEAMTEPKNTIITSLVRPRS